MKSVAILFGALLLAACGQDEAQNMTDRHNETSPAAAEAKSPRASTNPCLVQNGKPVTANRIKAVGTEPFWAARIEGRCVTYMTPEDQQGTRIWTRFGGTVESGLWSGALDGRRFELRTRLEPGCSDGMSDKGYPISVTLIVRGEQRSGCAEPF